MSAHHSQSVLGGLVSLCRILINNEAVLHFQHPSNVFISAKIRRLYDIANVLSSLELIKKVHITEERGRKPAFKWTGPDVFSDIQGKWTVFQTN